MEVSPYINLFVKYLKSENIHIDFEEFRIQIETHPDFPSLLSYHDALTFFKIENIVAKISNEDVDELPKYFIAELNINNVLTLVLAKKDEDNFIISSGGKNIKKISKKKFFKIWTGIILIAEKVKETKISKSKLNFWLPSLVVIELCLAALIVGLFSLKTIYFGVFNIIGIFFAVEALKQEFKIKTKFSSAFCSISKRTSCDTVINSQKFKLFKKFGLSDLSIIFFIGQLLFMFLMIILGLEYPFIYITTTILILSVPITFASIYYQWLIEKKWCPICLGIIGILYTELIISYFFFKNFYISKIGFLSAIIFLISYLTPLVGWVLLKHHLRNYFDLKSERISLIRLKRNYELFNYALEASKKINYETLTSKISIGNPLATLKITVITNPLCGYCKDTHQMLKALIKRYPVDILINIRFSFNPDDSNKKFSLLQFRLVQIYFEKGETSFMDAYDYWFKNKDYKIWFTKFGYGVETSEVKKILSTQFEQNMNNELLFTPTLILGEYIYPKMYDNEDLKYYINDLLYK